MAAPLKKNLTEFLKDNGRIAECAKDKAEMFNEKFCSVFTKENLDSIPDKGQSPYQSMFKIHVTLNGVIRCVKRLNSKKACGPDKMPILVLQETVNEIAPVLQRIFQQSLDSSEIPSDWKKANIVPIFKKGDRTKSSNYRPVPLLYICRASCRFRPSLTHTRHGSNKADDDQPPPWAPRQVPLGDTFKAIKLTKKQNKGYWVGLHENLNKDWKKELVRMHQRIKEKEDQPKPEPHLLHMVMRVKSTRGRPYWEKNVIKEMGLDGKLYLPKIFPNKVSVNERLSRVKHLIEILPVRFPYGLPETEEDYEHCVLRENGEFVVTRKLREKNEVPALVTEEDPTTIWDMKQHTIDRTILLKKMHYQLNAEYFPTEYIYKRNEDGKEFRYSGKDNVGLGKKWY